MYVLSAKKQELTFRILAKVKKMWAKESVEFRIFCTGRYIPENGEKRYFTSEKRKIRPLNCLECFVYHGAAERQIDDKSMEL